MKQSLFLTVIFYTAVFLQSCKKEAEVPVPKQKGTFVTLMNACPGSGEVRAQLESSSNTLIHKLHYLSITGYYAAVPGSYQVDFTSFPIVKELASATCTLQADKSYLVMVAGKVGRARVLVTENSKAIPKAGKAHVRFINVCSDSCKVDLMHNGLALFTDINYKDITSYKELDAGNVNFSTRANADGENLTQTSVFLESQKNYTFLLVGSKDGVNEEALDLKFVRY